MVRTTVQSRNILRKSDLFPETVSCLGLAAPAGPVSKAACEAALKFLSGLDIEPIPGASILKKDTLSYVSAPAADRAADLNAMIRNPKIQAVYCLRGGYGSVHLLNLLDWDTLRQRNLPVVGYSDLTALHAAMQSRKAGIAVSACMALRLEEDSQNAAFRRNFKRSWGIALQNRGRFRRIAKLHPCHEQSEQREVRAPLFCGNLTTLASLCGSGFLPEMSGRLVLLEDISEPVRKLDRTLMQLKLSGFFAGCAAVVFGNFKQCGDPEERGELFRRFAAELPVPVFAGLHYGHCSHSLSLVCGETALIRNGSLYLRDPFSE